MKPWLSETQSGPSIPYPAQARSESYNYGYVDLKRNPEKVSEIPELQDLQELAELVQTLNRADSIFRTLGCERSLSKSDDPQFRVKLVSYVDIAFEVLGWNHRENFVELFNLFLAHLQERDLMVALPDAIAVEFETAPCFYADHGFSGRLVTIWNYGYGDNENEAIDMWSSGLKVVRDFLVEQSSVSRDELKKGYQTIS